MFNSSSVYAVTRVRARKPRLVQPEGYTRMLQMDGALLAKNIGDLGYQTELNELLGKVPDYELMERALLVNMAKDFTQVQGFCGPGLRERIEAYLGRIDVRNIISLVRHVEMGEDRASLARVIIPYRSWAGDMPENLLSLQSSQQALDMLSSGHWFSPHIPRAAEALRTGGLGWFEDELQRIYFAYLLGVLSKDDLADRNMELFIKHEIDIANILTAVKFSGRKADLEKVASRAFIPGGLEMERNRMKELMSTVSLSELKSKLEGLDLLDDYEGLLDGKPDQVRLYATVASVRVRLARRFSFIYPLTILPILHYIVSKEQEVENLRILVRGKERGLTPQDIESLMVVAA